MSFFGSGGGFGSSSQNQSNTFGGFGQNNTNTNTTGGFGSTNNNTGFGTGSNTGGSLFGGGSGTGFGSGGFGSTASNTGFGSTTTNNTSGGIFGGSNTTTTTPSTGFGGLATNNASTGFGSNTNTGSIFGQAKPGFGSTSTTTGGSLFGNNNANTGFGSSTSNNTGFGATANTGFGSSQNQNTNQGTGTTPFQAHLENEGTGGLKAQYQSIVFQQPYQNYSFEELRLADYNAGRKFANQGGQAGAFGTSTGFGGFGGASTTNNTTNTGFGASTSSSPFGQNTTPAFGGSNNATSGFGTSNTTGSLFGNAQSKPGGIFGNNTTTTTPQTGSLFGAASNTNTGFGGNTGFGANNSGSVFGNANAAQTQAKPAFGFGNNTATTNNAFGQNNNTTTSAFGNNANTNTGGSLFGNNNTTNAFGQPQNNTNAFGGGFGSNTQQNTQNQSGGLFGGSFGANNTNNNEQKPGGLFGNTTGGSLFGNNQQNQQNQNTGGLLGNTNNQQTGGLFGNKPATTTPSLFGNTNTNNTGGGLFGNTGNQQQTPTTSLFGNTTTQNKPSLFGLSTNTNNNAGGGLFGNTTNNNQQQSGGGSLFGNTQNQQPALGGSLFGSTNQQAQQPQQLTTSINAANPYGNEHLFLNLATPQQSVGPIATPLSSSQKGRKPAPLPQYKLNPSASSRLITPQKRSGYGFSYTSYGTPGSATSNASPIGFGGSFLGSGARTHPLGKSFSTSNLRSSFGGESILAPGAFSPSSTRSYNGAGSLKKLHINRNLRTDLFGDSNGDAFKASPLKKRVSFGDNVGSDDSPTASPENVTNSRDRDSETPPRMIEYHKSTPNGNTTNNNKRPEMEQVKGNELAIVPEDGPAPETEPATAAEEQAYLTQTDQKPGKYYMKPPRAQLAKMTRAQLANIENFVVGREGCGKIVFDRVNLNDVDLDKICGDIVQLATRQATVYHENANKPPAGQKLNVPATVTLGNSWPRARGGRIPVFERKGPRFDKHIERLRRVQFTEYVGYNERTGEWTFRVQHFSTYALDYTDYGDDASSALGSPTGDVRSASTQSRDESSFVSGRSGIHSNPDDTFAFRSGRFVPGAFDDDYDSDAAHSHARSLRSSGDSAAYSDEDSASDMDMAGSFPAEDEPVQKASQLPVPDLAGTPRRSRGAMVDDWADELRRTVSPKKQNRQQLRLAQQDAMDVAEPQLKPSMAVFDKSVNQFATSIDVMKSLFGEDARAAKGKKQSASSGFQWPYQKHTLPADAPMSTTDRAFYDSFKPHWTVDGTLVYRQSSTGLATGERLIRYAALDIPEALPTALLDKQRELSTVTLADGVPYAQMQANFDFGTFAALTGSDDATSRHEQLTWQLAAVLFEQNDGASNGDDNAGAHKEKLSTFWEQLVRESAIAHANRASTAEEKAIAYLSGFMVTEACNALAAGRDFRLATQLPFIGGGQEARTGMQAQIDEWRNSDMLSEMTPAIRTLYELLAGNVCVSQGKGGAGAENRAETFCISSRFNLDWMRSFGLRLWYGALPSASIADVIRAYKTSLERGDERVQPAFGSSEASTREDLLWGLLKIYENTDAQGHWLGAPQATSDALETILDPHSVSGSPLGARLSFQLYHCLAARNIAAFAPEHANATADVLTADYTFELASGGAVVPALFVALHLTDTTSRRTAITTLLMRIAAATPTDQVESMAASLETDFLIPAAWLWAARAPYVRAVERDEVALVRCLLRAGQVADAHEVLSRRVAPRAIIQEDLGMLRDLLQGWDAQVRGHRRTTLLPGWTLGGAVYTDYLRAVELASQQTLHGAEGEELRQVLRRLAPALCSLGGTATAGGGVGVAPALGLEERVAVSEMSRVVLDIVRALGGNKHGRRRDREVVAAETLAALPVARNGPAVSA